MQNQIHQVKMIHDSILFHKTVTHEKMPVHTQQHDEVINIVVDNEEKVRKKILIRRLNKLGDKSSWRDVRRVQNWRHLVQAGFVLLNVYLCALFYVWVRYYETGAQGLNIARPEGVEGWLPIAGLMNLKYALVTWSIPPVHAAAMFLLVAFLLISILLKKSFCSWLCPIGTFSEALWRTGQRMLGHNFNLPRWLDIPLRALKYALLALFLYIVVSMSARDIAGFMGMPYGLIADVKMMNFFRYMGVTAWIVIGLLVLGSVFVQNF